MIWIIAGIIGIIILIAIAAAKDNTPTHHTTDYEPPSRPQPPAVHWERNHFINQHLHRNDERQARHKRNQTPW